MKLSIDTENNNEIFELSQDESNNRGEELKSST